VVRRHRLNDRVSFAKPVPPDGRNLTHAMQTDIIDSLRDTPLGREADRILRTCVHCGFCNATCPTYQLLGDELDGPRGRIYLMKQVLEGRAPSAKTLLHLDRCLTCRACESTCPSGVRYGALLEIGRDLVERQVRRPMWDRWKRRTLLAIIPHRARFTALLRVGQLLRPLLPPAIKRSVPVRGSSSWPSRRETLGGEQLPQHSRRMLVLEGCAQPALAPNINAAAARVLDRLGISLIAAAGAGCCGAASHHTSASEKGLDFARRNIDAWWPHIEAGCEAIVMTASGCGVHVKDYGHLLAGDPAYATKAARIAALTRDCHARPACASGCGGYEPEGCVPLALHAAARTEAERRDREDSGRSGLQIDQRARRASLLRLGGNILHPAAVAVAPVARAQAQRSPVRQSRHHRHSQYWLPCAFVSGCHDSGVSLGRAIAVA